jgi:hypothetical protein
MDTTETLDPRSSEMLNGDTDGDISNVAELVHDQDSHQSLDWLVSEDTTFEGLFRFDYDEQKAIVECICGAEHVVEVYSGSPSVCRNCGRQYSLETRIVVNWDK